MSRIIHINFIDYDYSKLCVINGFQFVNSNQRIKFIVVLYFSLLQNLRIYYRYCYVNYYYCLFNNELRFILKYRNTLFY